MKSIGEYAFPQAWESEIKGSQPSWLERGISNFWKGITGSGQTDAQIEANQRSMELQKYNSDLEMQRWREMNEYNSPANQRKLLEAAGYNSALLLGNPGSYTAGSPAGIAPYADIQSSGFPNQMAGIQSMVSLFSSLAGLRNLLLAGDNKKAQTDEIMNRINWRDTLNPYNQSILMNKGTLYGQVYGNADYQKGMRDLMTKRVSLTDKMIKNYTSLIGYRSGMLGQTQRNISSLIDFRNWQKNDYASFNGFGFKLNLPKLAEAFMKMLGL